MVHLTRIYTRTGDAGTTRLGDFSEVSKTDPRIAAYADVDEAGAALGLVLALGSPSPEVAELLTRVQNELFDLGADLCTPVLSEAGPPESTTALRITQEYVDRLESACDAFNEHLEPLRSFILAGGTPTAALLHQTRTVVRRAERSGWAAREVHGDSVSLLALTYLNRLSDLVFILARHANREVGDVMWVPGATRS